MNNKILIKEGGKLFGIRSQRVTTREMNIVFMLLEEVLMDSFVFKRMTQNRSFKSKETHGDVDIIVLPHLKNWKEVTKQLLEKRTKDQISNGDVHSFLLTFPEIQKDVHVDFIVSSSIEDYHSKNQYYSFNDLSAMIGIIGKKNHFKFGSNGFFKRYQDKRGNWHDILISKDLNIGLRTLGFDVDLYNKIEDIDDAVEFIASSKFFDTNMFQHENMTQDQKKDEKRPNIEYMIGQIRSMNFHSSITDEDFYFKKLYPKLYAMVEEEKQNIESSLPQKSQYNGSWLMSNFNIKPGPQVGMILKAISNEFPNLDEADETEVYEFVLNLTK